MSKYFGAASSSPEAWQGPKISSCCSQTLNGISHSESKCAKNLADLEKSFLYLLKSLSVPFPLWLCVLPSPLHRAVTQYRRSLQRHQFPRRLEHTGSPAPSTEHQHLSTGFGARRWNNCGFAPVQQANANGCVAWLSFRLAGFVSWFTHVRYIGSNEKTRLAKKGLVLLLLSDWQLEHSSFKKAGLKH